MPFLRLLNVTLDVFLIDVRGNLNKETLLLRVVVVVLALLTGLICEKQDAAFETVVIEEFQNSANIVL